MEGIGFQQIFSSQKAQKELVNLLKKGENRKLFLSGLSASSKAYVFTDAAESLNSGIHFVLMNNKEEAEFFSNDLYNILGDEYVYYFPTSSNNFVSRISALKNSSQKVQRSAAISSLENFLNGEFHKKFIVFVTYPGAIYEKVVNRKKLSANIFKISENDTLSHEFIKETLQAYNFEKVDFVSEPGQFALR